MTPTEITLGGIVTAVISGTIVKLFSNKSKMSENHCIEKQISCQKLLIEKIDNLGKKVDDLSKVVNNKLLGV
jgi:hypothetical protein